MKGFFDRIFAALGSALAIRRVECRGGNSQVWGNWRHDRHRGRRFRRCLGCDKIVGCDTCIKTPADAERVLCRPCGLFAGGDRLIAVETGRAMLREATENSFAA